MFLLARDRDCLDSLRRYIYYTNMVFEFDPAKSDSNRLKHGIGFDDAQALWDDPNRVTFVARFQGEVRHGIIARYADKHWCGIFTERGESIRIISVRRARNNEEQLYDGTAI